MEDVNTGSKEIDEIDEALKEFATQRRKGPLATMASSSEKIQQYPTLQGLSVLTRCRRNSAFVPRHRFERTADRCSAGLAIVDAEVAPIRFAQQIGCEIQPQA